MNKKDQENIFSNKGIIEIIDEKSFLNKLKSKKKLRIKMGFDPTSPDIHLGHAVGLRKLKELQDMGHEIMFLVGDYTTKIGDPSGRKSTRPILTDAEIKKNAKTYLDQAGKILDLRKTKTFFNSKWFKKMSFADILNLAGKFTVAQIIERDDFKKRLKDCHDIGLYELLYPLMQAYDSVVLKADVEFGGSDQRFNMLAGRDLQKKVGQDPQDIVMTKLLVGLDGKEKMSKSLGNYIGVLEDAKTMFGKVMSIPDDLIVEYFDLCTDLTENEVSRVKDRLKTGDNPRDLKMELASEIIKTYHSEREAQSAKEEFIKVFAKKELPSDLPKVTLDYGNYELMLLLANLSAVASSSEARRVIEQGGVKIDNTRITDPKAEVAVYSGMVIQVGKRKAYKIK